MQSARSRWPSPHTDLAVEATAAQRGRAGGEIPGVRVQEERYPHYTVTRVEVYSPEGEQALGKQQGTYVTIDCPGLRQRNLELQEAVGRQVSQELQGMLPPLDDSTSVLIVGLGNARATPDALGPRVVERCLATRHLKDYVPADLRGGLRPVAALAPGVLGNTGIETGEIVQGVVEHIRPSAVIAIDALAARNIERIATTVQLADTGIHPGSGLGSRRIGLNRATLGVPVLALGVPTVVHASTIAYDTLELLSGQLRGRSPFFDLLGAFTAEQIRQLVHEVLHPTVGDLVVTPKDVDDLIQDMSRLIAGSLNAILHTSDHARELLRYV